MVFVLMLLQSFLNNSYFVFASVSFVGSAKYRMSVTYVWVHKAQAKCVVETKSFALKGFATLRPWKEQADPILTWGWFFHTNNNVSAHKHNTNICALLSPPCV